MKILIVDDDPIVVQSCQRILEAEGMEIRTAGTVAAGTALLAGEGYDLMVADINMPGENGFKMISRATALRPDMPILIMTGYLTAETVEKCRRLGANHHIAKPFTPAELMAAVRRIP